MKNTNQEHTQGNHRGGQPIRLMAVCLGLLLAGGCRIFETSTPAPRPAIAAAITVDCSGTFAYLAEAEAGSRSIAGGLRPSDSLWLGAISDNSMRYVEPLSFTSRKGQSPKELQAFLNERDGFQQQVSEWFLRARSIRYPGSDICSAIRVAGQELGRATADRKILIVYSDMNDTATRRCPLTLNGVHVRILYVYPVKGGPAAYAKFGEYVRTQLEAAQPASLEVFFPVQARTFNVRKWIDQLRKG